MRSKFSSLLLTGKAAALPLLMNNAQALTPLFSDVVSANLTQVQLPVAKQIVLDSLGDSVYSGTAIVCSDANTMSDKLSVVLTGLKDQDTVFVLTSTNTGGYQNLNSKLKIGVGNLVVTHTLTIRAAGSSHVSASVELNLNELRSKGYSLSKGSRFYMQTVVFPNGIQDFSTARYSELDIVSVMDCPSTTPYGGGTYGGTY